MRALVTGATGFIGGHLVEALINEGFDVTCLTRPTSNLRYLEGLNISFLHGDCTDPSTLSKVHDFDYIFHLAGLTKFSSEDEAVRVNEKGTENIADAAIRGNSGLKRFVYVSSLAAAGPCCQGKPLIEDCEPQPVSVYGRTKLGGEKAVLGRKGKMPFTIIRPPAVYGPRDRDLLVIFKMVKMGLVPYWGKAYYSFLYVDDLVHGIILSALKEEGEGEIFFMSDGGIYSSDDLIAAISQALQCSPIKLGIPKFVMPLFGALAEKLPGCSIINPDKMKEIRHSLWTCDSNKAREKLGFSPKVKIKEGAKWTADWYRIHNWL
ncbi:MAG TPA: NAD(P)-dependent oxidoreductase [Dissulfurispiraceae bacterium]|nr:NAD(P)-dependent oxidoreductase [Dissulfurispiraceae bacterium]